MEDEYWSPGTFESASATRVRATINATIPITTATVRIRRFLRFA
jgi:hypothetical protein